MGIPEWNTASRVWATLLWQGSWQGGLALLLVLTVGIVWRRMPARVRCWLWRLAYLKLLIAGFWFSPLELKWLSPLEPATADSVSNSAGIEPAHAFGSNPSVEYEDVSFASGSNSAHRSHAVAMPARSGLTPTSWLMLAWAVGAGGVFARLVWQWLLVRSIRAGLTESQDPRIERCLHEIGKHSRLWRLPPVRISSAAGSPCLIGVFRPVIVLPEAVLESCSSAALGAAIAHELAHVKRRDLLWNWLPAVTEVLFYFHPMVWLARREWRLAQEVAADDLAISTARVETAQYAARLLELLATCRTNAFPTHLAVAVSETFSQFSRRISAMQSFRPLTTAGRFGAGLILTAAVCSLIPCRLTNRAAQAQEPSAARSPVADVPSDSTEATPAAAILHVRTLGGDIVFDNQIPERPAISVSLFKTKVTDSDLSRLKVLTTLRALNVDGTRVTDAGLVHIAELTNLQALDLNETGVTDAGLANLGNLTRMEELGLIHTKVTGDGLAHLKKMDRLVMLLLENTRVTDDGLAHLSGLTRLMTLNLSSTPVADDGVKHLVPLTELRDLRLNYTQAGDPALAHVRGMKRLQTLLLHKTNVTDAGVVQLGGLKNLQYLDLDKTPVTAAAIKKLQTELPACKIIWNGPEDSVAELLEEFEKVEFWRQEEIGMRLIASGDPSIIPAMNRLLDTPQRRRRCNAARVLDALGDPEGLAVILRELEDTSVRPVDPGGRGFGNGKPNVGVQIAEDRYYAAVLLGRIAKKEAVPALIRATTDQAINYAAAISLGQIGDRQAIPALRRMAIDFPKQRHWAGYGLAALGEQEGFDILTETALSELSHWVDRRHAVEALGKVGDRRATATLVKALKDEHVNVRVSAAIALGKIGGPAALAALTEALADTEETTVNSPTTVAATARKAIDEIKARAKPAPNE
jgi:beta-lactamase regulating signal transducer with metallopeptidase domain/HEAT repeat protein